MRFLYVGAKDIYARHELGFIASLLELGEVDVINMSGGAGDRVMCVGSDNGVHKIPVYSFPCSMASVSILNRCTESIKRILERGEYDVIFTTPRMPIFLTSRALDRSWFVKRSEKLVLRLWSIRAAKLRDNLRFGALEDIILFTPSLLANLYYVLRSNYSIAVDHATYVFAKKSYPIVSRRLLKLYPPYGYICDPHEGEADDYVLRVIEDLRDYVLGFTVLSKKGPYLKFEAKPHAIVLYRLAKRLGDTAVVIAGSTYSDWKSVFPHIEPPRNLVFLGRGFSDSVVEEIYSRSRVVVIPITNRNISNRLIEAIYYGTAIISSELVKIIHPELEHMRHVYISSWDAIVEDTINIIRRESVLEELRRGAKDAYNRYFSTKINSRVVKALAEE